MQNRKKWLLNLIRLLPLFLCLGAVVAYFLSGQDITVDSLKNFAPSTPAAAVIFLLALYAIKSLTVFFPIVVLNALGGFLFSPFWAIAVNTVGVAIDQALPYWVGRLSGTGIVDKIEEKYPKFAIFFGKKQQNHFFMSFFLRAIYCLPGDLVSMYFGAIRMPFGKYMLSSMLGMLPGTVAATVLGVSISDPFSPLFWLSLGAMIGFALLSALIYRLWRKKQDR